MPELFEKIIGIERVQAFLPNISRFTNWQGLLFAVIDYLLYFAGTLAVLSIVYSGILYITSGSMPGTKEKPGGAAAAKKNLTWAITGLIIIILALVIFGEVGKILGGAYN